MNGKVGELYRKWQPEGAYDAIVIGSGIGGLSVAALLAKHDGRRVLVLERHTTAGGFTHTFSRKGYEWDVGLHYIGQVGRGSMLRSLFDEVTNGALEWAPMGEVYDTVVIGGERWEYVAGREAWRARMLDYFPDEKEAIDGYLDRVREAIGGSQGFFAEKAVPAPVALLAGPWMRRRFLRHADRTVGEVLDGLTDNPTLKAVLCAQLGDYGLPPARASFAIHAMVFNHYLGGGAYPVGGSARIAEAVAPLIEATGGQIVIGAEVSTVLVEGGRAVGVRMADDRELHAELVISDAGVPNTVFRLLPEGTPGRGALLATLEHAERSASHICLYAGLEHTDSELGLDRSNLWVYPSTDQDGDFERYLADPEAPLPLVFISGTNWMKRGEDYEALKDELSRRLIEVLEREVPQVKGKIAYHELSTPLSTRHFADYAEGEIYGLEHTPARFRERALRPRTGLKGFYLTGQDVCTAGIAGALFGGTVAASAILGKNLLGEISRRNG